MDRKNFIQISATGLATSLLLPMASGKDHTGELVALSSQKTKIIKDGEGSVLNVLGDLQTHKLSGSETNDQIVEWVSNVEPGVGIPPHIHTREDEIFRVIEGEVEMMVDGEITILKAGDTAFAPRDLVHSWKVVGTEKAHMITSAFPAGIEVMFEELASLPQGPPDFEKVAAICAKQGISFVPPEQSND